MDSINKNQPEDHREDLVNVDAIAKIKDLVENAGTCFFCTVPHEVSRIPTRPMSVLKVDERGALWFLSANDSHKNREIEMDPHVQLYFQGSAHSDFMELFCKATITTDKSVIRELWQPLFKTWFTGGENDPRITALKLEPVDGYYWDNKHGNAVAGVKMMIGAVIGKTLDDSIEGNLNVR